MTDTLREQLDAKIRGVVQEINKFERNNFDGRNIPPSTINSILETLVEAAYAAGRRKELACIGQVIVSGVFEEHGRHVIVGDEPLCKICMARVRCEYLLRDALKQPSVPEAPKR